MKYLSRQQLLWLHGEIVRTSGGASGIRDEAGLDAALAQPLMTFDGNDLYPTLAEKAAALGHSLISNHPFFDGNKRIGHAAMEVMLVLNGCELNAGEDEQERVILAVAAGELKRREFIERVVTHSVERKKSG